MAPRLPSLLVPPIGFAHRGAKAHARENTLDAFELALRLGATGIESDAWCTSDGAVVLDHDGVVGRWPARRAVRSVAAAALPHHIPTLDSLYARIGNGLPVSLDLKDEEAFSETVAVARRHGALSNLWICHTKLDVLRRWRASEPAVRLVHSTRAKSCVDGLERHIATLSSEQIDALNMPHGDWTGGHVALAHRFGRYAFAWDAQLERILREMIDMGIDAVYSDWSDRMTDAFAAMGYGPSTRS